MNDQPLVCVRCITYNHAKYIRKCLNGFVMQKTNFVFEAIVHDDASTDGTADIIREYAEKYPHIIKPIYEKENLYSKNKAEISRIMTAAISPSVKYIACCEGDDYWIAPNKLQMQFDFMESHPDYSLCMHNEYCLNEMQKILTVRDISTAPEDGLEYVKSLLRLEAKFGTRSMFYRKKVWQEKQPLIKRDCKGAPMGDWQTVFHLALAGKVKIFPNVMAVYRMHPGSASGYSTENRDKELAFYEKCTYYIKKTAEQNGLAEYFLPPSPPPPPQRKHGKVYIFCRRIFFLPYELLKTFRKNWPYFWNVVILKRI